MSWTFKPTAESWNGSTTNVTDISYKFTGKLMGNGVGEEMGRKVDEKSHHIIFGCSEDRGTTNSFG